MNKVSVLGGNPKVEVREGSIVVSDPQMLAFQEAMKLVASIRDRVHRIAVAFDHKGIFGDQFVDSSKVTSRRQRKHLRLSQVHPDIRTQYADLAAQHGVDLNDISVITEDFARLAIMQRTKDHRVYSVRPQCNGDDACGVDEERDEMKVNCRGMAAAIVEKVARDSDEAHTFWVYDKKRVDPVVITMGTELAYELLGVRAKIQQHMIVSAEGKGNDLVQNIAFNYNEQEQRADTEIEAYKPLL